MNEYCCPQMNTSGDGYLLEVMVVMIHRARHMRKSVAAMMEYGGVLREDEPAHR